MGDLFKAWACLVELGDFPEKANACKEVLIAFCKKENINFDIWARSVLSENNIPKHAKTMKENAARQLAERAHHMAYQANNAQHEYERRQSEIAL
jgi:hypothetical protein